MMSSDDVLSLAHVVMKRRHLVLTHKHDLFRIDFAAAVGRTIAEREQGEPECRELSGTEVCYIPSQLAGPQLISLAAALLPLMWRPTCEWRQKETILREEGRSLFNATIDLGSLHTLTLCELTPTRYTCCPVPGSVISPSLSPAEHSVEPGAHLVCP
jgi:hypothetical protein